MSVSQAVGAPHSSRRRRKGGPSRRIAVEAASSCSEVVGRGVGDDAMHSFGNGGGRGRGGGRRTLWEDKDSPTTVGVRSNCSNTGAGAHDEDDQGNDTAIGRVAMNTANAKGGSHANGGSSGRNAGRNTKSSGFPAISGVGAGRGVNPAMLESEFISSTGQDDAGLEGAVTSLSLEEVPYDRDPRWCNTSSASRPRPTMDTSGGVFGRIGAAITQDTGDYERLDRHYQELWKDREEAQRGGNVSRSGRSGRAGRGRGRSRGSGGRSARQTNRGNGSSDVAGRGGNGGSSSSSAGRGGGGQSRGPPLTSASKGGGSPVSKGGEGGVAATLEAGGGGGGGGVGSGGKRRNQKTKATGGSMANGSSSSGGNGSASGGVAQPPVTSSHGSQQAFSAYRASSSNLSLARKGAFAVQGGPLPNGRHRWESSENATGFVGVGHRSGAERDPWTPTSGSPVPRSTLSPPHGALAGGALGVVDGRGIVMSPMAAPLAGTGGGLAAATTTTPPHIPTLTSLLGLQSDSPEYLDDLANALRPTPSPRAESLVRSLASSPPRSFASALFPGNGIDTPRALQESATVEERERVVGGNGNITQEATTTPKRSTRPLPDIGALADPSLDVDIQDICVDPDLNADAPAFVPGAYLPG